MSSFADKVRVSPQYVFPQHGYSKAIRAFANIRSPLVSRPSIWAFNKLFDIDMAEAEQPDTTAYNSLNALFTRSLKTDARPLPKNQKAIASPADGAISEWGQMQNGQLLQAKGQSYSAAALLGGDNKRAATFENGSFATVYLAPHNYHRVHAPVSGQLEEMHHIPGRLFSVNMLTARTVPGLFARNERVVTIFNTKHGKVAAVLVGAMGVGHIETTWAGQIEPAKNNQVTTWRYPKTGEQAVALKAGDELGRFNLGSTVVMLFEKPVEWSKEFNTGSTLLMGNEMGAFK